MKEKIKLHAVYRKDGRITICDQDGRQFAAEPSSLYTLSSEQDILLEVTLHAPRYPEDTPRVSVEISIPLEVEERLPLSLLEALGHYEVQE